MSRIHPGREVRYPEDDGGGGDGEEAGMQLAWGSSGGGGGGGGTFLRRHPLLLCLFLLLAVLYVFLYRVFVFLLASSPVLLLTAFLLGVVLVYSEPNLPVEEQHLYKKIRRRTTAAAAVIKRHGSESALGSSDSDVSTATSLTSSLDGGGDQDDESEPEPGPEEKDGPREVVRAVAWTAEDDKSIENIGSLELERNATVEKLMYRRRARRQRQHADLIELHDGTSSVVSGRKNPFDLDILYDEDDFPGSAPSMHRNPFFFDDDDTGTNGDGGGDPNLHLQSSSSSAQRNAGVVYRRHESFTVGAPFASDFRPSRFRPYFVTEKMQGQPVVVPDASGKSSSSSSSSSSADAGASKEAAAAAEEAVAAATLEVKTSDDRRKGGMVVAVDVELISDSSDDDMSLPAAGDEEQEQQMQMKKPPLPPAMAAAVAPAAAASDEDDDGESFEVESITKQVIAATAAPATERHEPDADPAYGYSSPAPSKPAEEQAPLDEGEKQAPPHQPEAAGAPAVATPSKLISMRRTFRQEDEDEAGEAWAAPRELPSAEETKQTATEREKEEPDTSSAAPLPPLGSAPSLKEKGAGKGIRYKPPSKKAVLGFFRK